MLLCVAMTSLHCAMNDTPDMVAEVDRPSGIDFQLPTKTLTMALCKQKYSSLQYQAK